MRRTLRSSASARWSALGAIVAAGALLAGCGTAIPGSATATGVDVTTSSSQPSDEPEAPDDEPSGDTPGDEDTAAPSTLASLGQDGVITVQSASTVNADAVTVDIFEDALCPYCGAFEQRYGDEITAAITSGYLVVGYHFVNFLDSYSASGDYSTRAYAALQTVADLDGNQPDVWQRFHASLFDVGTQPEERASADLTDEDLADLAEQAGASSDSAAEVAVGARSDTAADDAQTNLSRLQTVAEAAGTRASTPFVAHDGKPLDTSQSDWLQALFNGLDDPTDEDQPPAGDQPGDGEITDAAALSAALASSVDDVSSNTTTLTMDAAGMTMEITMQQTFQDGMVDAFDMQIGSIMGSPGMNVRQVDGVAYFGPADALEALGIDAGGKDWVKLDPDSDNPVIASMAEDFGEPVVATDPESLDKMVQASVGFSNLGSDPVDGVPATHYELVVGLAELAELMPGTVDPVDIDDAGISQMPIDLWMDDENRLVKMEIDMGAAQSKVTAFITGYNEPVDIQAPDPADIGQP